MMNMWCVTVSRGSRICDVRLLLLFMNIFVGRKQLTSRWGCGLIMCRKNYYHTMLPLLGDTAFTELREEQVAETFRTFF